MIKKWYETSFRRHLIDMHIEDWDESFLSVFDEKMYFENLKRAHIQSPMIYLQAHTGLCNWDSKSGRVHNAFHNNNKIKRLIDLCHADGMNVIAYYSLIYNNWAYETHPEWRMIDFAGKCSRDKTQTSFESNARYGIVCPNNAGYRSFLQAQMAEFCEEYDFEGLFLDMTFWPTVCYCDSCKKRYKEETGKELPYQIDWFNPEWVEFQRHREAWLGEFASFCTQEVKRHKKDVAIEHQFAIYAKGWKFGCTEAISDASDYCGGDLYGGFLEQSFICKAYYETTKNQPFEYMTSRCDPDLSDHTTTKTHEQLAVHNFLTLAHHGAFLIIDAINLDGTMDANVYSTMGEVFEKSQPYEPYMSCGVLKADLAIYHSLESKMDVLDRADTYATISQHSETLASCLGAAACFTRHHILYTVLSKTSVDKIKDKQAVVLSNTSFLTAQEMDVLTQYVEQGGSLYISGTTDARLVERLLGLRVTGYTQETVVYVAPTAQGQQYFGSLYTSDRPICWKHRHPICVNDNPSNEILATVTLPKTLPSNTEHFASIHSNPPSICTHLPSIVRGCYGKGKVIWSGAALEQNAQNAHKDVFFALEQSLHTTANTLRTDAPAFVEFTVFESEKADYIHCVNVDDHAPMLPCKQVSLGYRPRSSVTQVTLLPCKKSVPFALEDGYIRIEAKDIEPFQMYEINY